MTRLNPAIHILSRLKRCGCPAHDEKRCDSYFLRRRPRVFHQIRRKQLGAELCRPARGDLPDDPDSEKGNRIAYTTHHHSSVDPGNSSLTNAVRTASVVGSTLPVSLNAHARGIVQNSARTSFCSYRCVRQQSIGALQGATLHSGNAQRVCPDDLHDRKSISIFAGVSIPRNGATTAWILDDCIGYLSG